jgi:hypothetical protein
MKKLVIVWMALFAVSAALTARETKAAADVSGVWDLAVKGPAAHGGMNATLELHQEGKKVTGSLAAHGNRHTLAGEFADGELALEATDVPADKALTLNAKLKDDGTLAGYLSGPMGDMQWTGQRNVER